MHGCAGADLERFDRVRTNPPWILYSNLHFLGSTDEALKSSRADLAINNGPVMNSDSSIKLMHSRSTKMGVVN